MKITYGSLAEQPDFRKALRTGRVKAPPRGLPKLSLPFSGKPDKVFALQTEGLVRRLRALAGAHVVIGLSGGLDSTLALLVARAAFRQLGRDERDLHVLTMPGFGTTSRTRGNAEALCAGLGLACRTISIARQARLHLKEIGHDGKTPDLVYENAQARIRTLVLMDVANAVGGIVLGTGDMSEIALGWSTYNGDHMSMFAVNAGVPKTTVREVCGWWADETEVACGGRGPLAKAVAAVRDVMATPVSPELIRGQVTEDKLGPYELHDFFLAEFVGRNKSRSEIFAAAFRRFGARYDAATLGRWLDVFLRRVVRQAFKRNCAPDGVKVFRNVYFGPEDWHIPSDCPCIW